MPTLPPHPVTEDTDHRSNEFETSAADVGDHAFAVEHLQADRKPNGTFTPDAQVVVLRALRTSGLLAHLPDSETKTLFAVLTQLTANGRLDATAGQVAAALGVPEAKARSRLDRLCRTYWRGRPVACEHVAESGLRSFSLSSHIVTTRDRPATRAPADEPEPLPPAAGRDAVIAHSRSAYGRPRAEVEREIAELYGRGADIDRKSPAGRLVALGVPPEDARVLEAAHPPGEIADQIDWLPYRGAKNPARFVVAAIEGRYEPPARVRLDRAVAAEDAGESAEGRSQDPADLTVGETASLPLPGDEAESDDE